MNIFSFLKKKKEEKTLSDIKTAILMQKGKEQLQKLIKLGVSFPVKIAY